ncbi:MAG: NfeD family protein [Aristaeellaceae bacterium]
MLEWIAVNLPLLVCFVVGIGLLVLEAFMPGFGLPGISGIVMEIVAIALTWVNHGPVAALGLTIIVLSLIAIAISMSLRSATKGRLSRSKIILKERESNEAGYRSAEDMQVFLGKEGETTTVCRPTGMAEFDGVKLNVVSEGEFLPAGTRVRIVQVEGSRIVVRVIKG